MDIFPSFPVFQEENAQENFLYIAWEVSTESIPFSTTVVWTKHSPHWLLHPLCDCLLAISLLLPAVISPYLHLCHVFKLCSEEGSSKDIRDFITQEKTHFCKNYIYGAGKGKVWWKVRNNYKRKKCFTRVGDTE